MLERKGIAVAKRSLVLATLSCRGMIDGEPEARSFWAEVKQWFVGLEIEDALEPEEYEIVHGSFGNLSNMQRVNAGWRSEGLAVLAWALGRAEQQAHDTQCDPRQIADSVGFLLPTPQTVLNSPNLRNTDEVDQYRSTLLSIHWRVREYNLNRRKIDFRKTADEAWFPLTTQGIPLADDDMQLAGVPISQASEDTISVASSIALERHHAANWLADVSLRYSEVDTST